MEKILESPLNYKEIKPVNPKENQSWIFIGRTDAEAEAPILWLPDVKNWLTRKDPDAGKDWRQEKNTAEDKMIGWHHQFNGHEFEQAPGVGDGQGSLVCCSPWGHKESDTTELLNWLISTPRCSHPLQSHFFVNPWTTAYQALPSLGFSRQEYWSGLPFPSPGDLPNPGIELVFLVSPALAGGFFTTSTTLEGPLLIQLHHIIILFQSVHDGLPIIMF